MLWYNVATVTGDSPTQQCDPSIVSAPYGIGLVFSVMPTRYEYAGCFNAINSSPDLSGLFLSNFHPTFSKLVISGLLVFRRLRFSPSSLETQTVKRKGRRKTKFAGFVRAVLQY